MYFASEGGLEENTDVVALKWQFKEVARVADIIQ